MSEVTVGRGRLSQTTARGLLLRMMLATATLLAAATANTTGSPDWDDSRRSGEMVTEKTFNVSHEIDYMFARGKLLTDSTLDSQEGHYVFASYEEGQEDDYRKKDYHCQKPTGPRCRLNFQAIIHSTYDLVIATRPRCEVECSSIVTFNTEPWQLQHVSPTYGYNGWTNESVPLGWHPTLHDLQFVLLVPDPDNVMALKDVHLLDCEPDDVPQDLTCPEDHFQCSGLHECLSHDQRCDLRDDCLCREDESDCETFESHPHAYLNLETCDFEAMTCFWYNTNPDSNFRWRVANCTRSTEERHIHSKNSGLPSPPPDKCLQLLPPHHRPGEEALLRSATFQPPPSTDGSCQARFWYRNTAKYALLQLQLVEVSRWSMSRPVRTLWTNLSINSDLDNNFTTDPDFWTRAVVPLNSAPINDSYVLQFKVSLVNFSGILSEGEVAVHSISLSPSCLYAAVLLTPCGASGARGPTQKQCDLAYRQLGLVSVSEDRPLAGVQSWLVPRTTTYRIQAAGSSGGLGASDVSTMPGSKGTLLDARFQLDQGDRLYVLVGQKGEDSCQMPPINDNFNSFSLPNTPHHSEGGGGGGGGATIVYKRTSEGQVEVLIVAGGGAGHPLHLNPWLVFQPPVAHDTGHHIRDVVATMSETEAYLLLNGSLEGSTPCLFSSVNKHCYGRGGFGVGGGACMGGGHGGGANRTDGHNLNTAGLPGRSYIDSTAMYQKIQPDNRWGPGFVDVYQTDDCGCEYLCLWLDDSLTTPTCICPDGQLAYIGTSCTDMAHGAAQVGEKSHVFLVIVLGALLAAGLCIFCVCLYVQRHTLQARHPTSIKKVASIMCPCLDLSRRAISLSAHVLPQVQRPPAIMHVNPNYDVITMKGPEQGLKELPRKHLKLMSTLGQGAFGEVYYGLLANVPMVDGDLPVAVKTLPQMCTEQTELDFLMEAVIVSKFNHPNIVKFIGVCFEQHPHYLVLELLEGGDLKGFLRQARPKWDQSSSLTVLDLLRLCLDVARGCQHLEDKHFIHRDIAARNCLLTTKGPNRTAKIADFGMARDIYRSDYYKKAGKAMLPVKWMPPEAFLDGVFTSKTDVWSFGILMWEVFSFGHIPYPGCSNEEVMNLVTQGGRLDPPESCPSSVFDIMAPCWSALPEGRPSFYLIIASLERALQDDDLVSRGLPVFCEPPITNTRGLRLQGKQTSISTRPKVTTPKVLACTSDTTLSPNTSADGYLEPLLVHGSRGQSHDCQYRSAPYNFNSSAEYRSSPNSLFGLANSRVFIDNGKANNRPICRTPRIFYKPGSSPATAVCEALLSPQESLDGCSLSEKAEEGLSCEQKYELCVDVNGARDGHYSVGQGVDSEEYKHSLAPSHKNRNKRKSYTNFPAPPT